MSKYGHSSRWVGATKLLTAALALFLPSVSFASSGGETVVLTDHWVGYTCLIIFVIAYSLVIAEERIHLRKSKPVIMSAGIIWMIIGWYYQTHDMPHMVEAALRHNLLEYAELMLFLLAAMTYINAMEERRLFDALRVWLVKKGFSYRSLFWITGILAFFISPVADNLTTALLMCAVVMAVGVGNTNFVTLACINIVVAANAGGAFSPFGDITTLMVWQKGLVHFGEFMALFLPSVVNFVIPAAIMSVFIGGGAPEPVTEFIEMKRGARRIVVLFLVTIGIAVLGHSYLGVPPVLGMMTGLGLLKLFGYYLRMSLPKSLAKKRRRFASDPQHLQALERIGPFDIFDRVSRAEWDTLLFFYGVIMSVGGLGFIGYLAAMSDILYVNWDPTYANIAVGVISALVDNIPVMFAVLTMQPDMSLGQWLLVTLTAGVGGSLLSIGSAAGVALMGQAKGYYTFFGHLKWSWAIALGYIASIWVHLTLNAELFDAAISKAASH